MTSRENNMRRRRREHKERKIICHNCTGQGSMIDWCRENLCPVCLHYKHRPKDGATQKQCIKCESRYNFTEHFKLMFHLRTKYGVSVAPMYGWAAVPYLCPLCHYPTLPRQEISFGSYAELFEDKRQCA